MICNRRFKHQIKLHLRKHRCTRNCCDCHITGFYEGLILSVHCNTCTFIPQNPPTNAARKQFLPCPVTVLFSRWFQNAHHCAFRKLRSAKCHYAFQLMNCKLADYSERPQHHQWHQRSKEWNPRRGQLKPCFAIIFYFLFFLVCFVLTQVTSRH